MGSEKNEASKVSVLVDVLAAMQNAEEAGGPEGKEYLDLMEKIAAEATRRAATYRATIAVKVCCPKCLKDDLADIQIMEKYTAYHPVRRVSDGTTFVENALGTVSPSEYFDDGTGEYRAHCRACLHEGTTEEFGIADMDWE